MPSKTLTDRQEQILLFIGRAIRDQGLPPTIREIGAATDTSSTSVTNYNLARIKRVGLIGDRGPAISRGLTITDEGRAWLASHGVVVPGADPDTAAVFEAAHAVVGEPSPEHVRALRDALQAVAA